MITPYNFTELPNARRSALNYVNSLSDLNQSLDETLKLLEFIESEVRKSAVEAVTEFTIAYFKVIDNILTNLISEDRY